MKFNHIAFPARNLCGQYHSQAINNFSTVAINLPANRVAKKWNRVDCGARNNALNAPFR